MVNGNRVTLSLPVRTAIHRMVEFSGGTMRQDRSVDSFDLPETIAAAPAGGGFATVRRPTEEDEDEEVSDASSSDTSDGEETKTTDGVILTQV